MEVEVIKKEFEKSMDGIFKTLEKLLQDNKNLKLKAYQPTVAEAKIILDFFSWEDETSKQTFQDIYKHQLDILDEWFEIYCKKYDCSKEEALSRVIDGVIG